MNPSVVELMEGELGTCAVITGPWSDAVTQAVMAARPQELELNHAKGWTGEDLSFLRDLTWLEGFAIIDWTIGDVSPIHALHELKRLKVITACKSEIDFAAFSHLERCSLEWRAKARSLFESRGLRQLLVNRYSGREFAPFAELVNLEELQLLSAPIERLTGIGALAKLRLLRLALLRKLQGLEGIETLRALRELQVQSCKGIGDIEPVAALGELRRLFLDNLGPIASLSPLKSLQALEVVGFVESTNVLDGDLSPLCGKPHLNSVSFQNRKHYSLRREDFRRTATEVG